MNHVLLLADLSRYYGTDWLVVICGLTANYLVGNRKRHAFLFGMTASASGAIFGIIASSAPYIVLNVITFFLMLRAWIRWSPLEQDHERK